MLVISCGDHIAIRVEEGALAPVMGKFHAFEILVKVSQVIDKDLCLVSFLCNDS